MDYRGLTVKIGADDSQLSKVLSSLRTEARSIDDELKQVNRSLKFDSSDVEVLARKQELYTEKIKNTEEQLEKMRDGLKNASAQNISTTQIERLRANIKECESNLTSYRAEVQKINNAQAFAEQAQQISACNREIAEQETKIKTLDNLLEQLPHDSELLAQKQQAVTSALEQSRAKVQILETTYSQLDKHTLGKDDWEKLELEIKQAQAEVRQYSTQLNQLNTAKLTAFSTSWKNVGASIKGVGSTLTGTLTPAVTLGTAAFIAAATEMDTALTGVKKTVDGTEEQYQQLKQAAIEFSLTNAVSAATIMDIQALGAQLGYAIDELDMFGQVVSGLDIATNMDAETAATELAQFANITKMAHSETENYGAAIVGLGNNFATTESDISHMAMRLAAAGTQVGLSQADILGLATAMSSLGIEAEAGGSAMSTVMSKIDRAVATGGESLETWASIAGMSANAFAQAWQNDPVAALQDVMVGINSASQSGENMNLVLDDLGIKELRQIDAMKRMSQNAELVGAAVAKSNEEWEKNTALSDEVANRNESLAAKFEMVKNRIMAIADEVGAPLADAFLAALDAAEPLFQAIESGAKTFAEMDEGQQQLILGLVGIAAAAGPTLTAVGHVVDGVGSLAGKLGLLAEKSGLAVKGISLLKGGLIGIGAAVAVAAIADLASQFAEYQQLCQNAADASMDLGAAIDSACASVSVSGESVESVGSSFDELIEKTHELTKAQAEMNKSAVDTFTDIETQSAVIGGLSAKLVELTTKYDENGNKAMLSAKEQAELATVVEAYNEATGSSIEILNASIGLTNASTQAVNDNSAAWEANAKKQAAQEMITDYYKKQFEIQEQIKKLNDEIEVQLQDFGNSDKIRELNTQIEELTEQEKSAGESIDYLNGIYLESESALSEINKRREDSAEALEDESDSMEGAADSAEDLTEAEQAEAEAAEKAAEAFEKLCDEIQELCDSNAGLAMGMNDSGYSVEALAQVMTDCGYEVSELESSIDDLANKSTNAFEAMEQASVLSVDEMLANLAKNRQATEDWADNVKALYDRAGDDVAKSTFVQSMAELGPEYASQLQELVDATPEKFDAMAALWYDGQLKAGKQALAASGLVRNELLADLDKTTESITGKCTSSLAQMVEPAQETSVVVREELKNQQAAYEDFSESVEDSCGEVVNITIDEAEAIGNAFIEIAEANAQAAESAEAAAEVYKSMCEELDEFTATHSLFAEAIDRAGYSVPDFAAALQIAGIDVSDFTSRIEELAGSTQNAFDKLEQAETISLDQMIANLRNNQDAVHNWRNNLIELYAMAGDDIRASGFVDSLAAMGPEYANQLQLIIDGGQEKFDELAQMWGEGANIAMSAAAESFDVGGGTILAGVDLTFSQLANSMADMGLNISDLGTLGADEFSALAESLGISVSDMAAVCDSLDIDLDDKLAATVDGSIAELERIKESQDIPADSFVSISESAGTMSDTTQGHVSDMADGTTESMEQAAESMSASAEDASAKVISAFDEMESKVSSSAQNLAQTVSSTFEPMPDELHGIGVDAGAKFAEGILNQQQVTTMCAEAVATAAQEALEALADPAKSAGTVAGNYFAGAILNGQQSAQVMAQAVANAAKAEFDALAALAKSAGTSAGSQFSVGILDGRLVSQAAAQQVVAAANTALSDTAYAYTSGTHLGGQFAAGIASQVSQVSYAAAQLAQAAKNNIGHTKPKEGPLKSGEEIFGRHLAQNFADGIGSSWSKNKVADASNELAQQVVDYLGHTTPKKGALKGGEWVYGQHAAINFAEGLYDGRDKVAEAAEEIAEVVVEEVEEVESHFDIMVENYSRNVNQIKNLSLDLSGVITDMATAAGKVDLTYPAYASTAAFKDLDKIVKAGYKDIESFRSAAKDFAKEDKLLQDKIAQNNADYVKKLQDAQAKYDKVVESGNKKLESATESWNKKQSKLTEANTAYWEAYWAVKNNTDSKKAESLQKKLDTANKNWYKAESELAEEGKKWYALEAENKKAEAEAAAELKKTQASIKDDYKKSSAELKSEYKAFRDEYEAYQDLASTITVPLDKLEASGSLYKVTTEIMGSIGGSTGLTAVLEELGTKGVQYTQEFVDAMVNGGEEYVEALGDMSEMTAEQIQSFVDSFESAEIAEREAALAARSLYVEHGKQSSTVKNARETWLDFCETVLDVKEAMNGDQGLSKAFLHAGTSVEGLAADLLSLGVSMDDIVSKATSWSEKVSNGFSALSSEGKTGASEYMSTLKNNMAETQAYTANVEAVFSKLTNTALEETEAFRKAVLEGGFDQYAGLMADMATMDADQIMQVIDLYNDSIQQGLQDSIQQFQALAPGEEMMLATVDGMESKRDEIVASMEATAKAAAEAGIELEPEFYNVGAQLASGISTGILAQAQSIAAAAAQTVRQAIAAAKAEADIHSPSRKMRDEVGLMLGRGIAEGVDDSNKYVRESMDALIGQSFVKESRAIDSRAYTTNTSININLGGVTVANDYDVNKMIKRINREQAWALKGMGM